MKDGKKGLLKYGPMPGDDEPLHAYISGPTQEGVTKAAEKVTMIYSMFQLINYVFLLRSMKLSIEQSKNQKE